MTIMSLLGFRLARGVLWCPQGTFGLPRLFCKDLTGEIVWELWGVLL